MVQLEAKAVLLGVEIRVLAVSSMWTVDWVSFEVRSGGDGSCADEHVRFAAVEMDSGWPLPRYAIPGIVSVLAGKGLVVVV